MRDLTSTEIIEERPRPFTRCGPGLPTGHHGQLFEVIGAAGYDGGDRVSGLATVHNVEVPLTPVGMVLAFVGAVCSLAALLLARSHPDSRRWVIGGMILAGVGATLFFVGGIVFGY